MRSWKAWAILGIACVIFLAQVWLFQGFVMDDTFISLRYLKQWTHGNGLVYNIGERVEGYSNFLWIVLLAPFDLLGMDVLMAAKGMGVLLSLLTLLLTWMFSRSISDQGAAPLFLAATGAFGAWAVAGLETPLFTCLLIAGGYAFVREEGRGRGFLSGTLFALLSVTRPEGLLFAFVAAICRGWILYRSRSGPQRQDWERLIAFVAITLPYFLWRLAYYGYPLPNTVYAKSMGAHPRAVMEGVFYLYQSLTMIGGFFLLALPLVLALTSRSRLPLVIYLGFSVIAYGAFISVGGGDWMPMQRFAVHVLPFVYLIVQIGLERVDRLWSANSWGKVLLLLLVWGQVAYLLVGSLEYRFLDGIGRGTFIPEPIGMVRYLHQNVGPEDTIAVVEAGRIAYDASLETRVLDMVGLTDAHIAHHPAQFPGGLFGRGDGFGKWDVDYVLEQSPRFVQANVRGQTADGTWLTMFTGTALLLNDPRFRELYKPVTDPGVKGVFVRKEGG